MDDGYDIIDIDDEDDFQRQAVFDACAFLDSNDVDYLAGLDGLRGRWSALCWIQDDLASSAETFTETSRGESPGLVSAPQPTRGSTVPSW